MLYPMLPRQLALMGTMSSRSMRKRGNGATTQICLPTEPNPARETICIHMCRHCHCRISRVVWHWRTPSFQKKRGALEKRYQNSSITYSWSFQLESCRSLACMNPNQIMNHFPYTISPSMTETPTISVSAVLCSLPNAHHSPRVEISIFTYAPHSSFTA